MNSIRNAIEWLLGAAESDPIVRLLRAWRFWVAAALLGTVLGGTAYAISPPPYRARASLTIDFNLEDMLPGYEPRKTFHFLDRETRKAQEIAWADDTLATVEAEFGDTTVSELRTGKLLLSQPSDGGWHFWAQDSDPERAQELAALWIEAFIKNIRDAIQLSADVEDARRALADAVYFTEDHDLEEIERLTQELSNVSEGARGVTPYVGVSRSQSDNLPLKRAIPLSVYLFVGAGLVVVSAALVMLVVTRKPAAGNSDA
ncbi:MAG: hypothetical protein IH859_09910 [Chloroflexi bacterium]|nr:hypothetical protein [Chloroflexota bacterium]